MAFLTASLTFQHADQGRKLSQPEHFFVDFGWEGSPDAFGPRAKCLPSANNAIGPGAILALVSDVPTPR
jgi:hypothetical protein